MKSRPLCRQHPAEKESLLFNDAEHPQKDGFHTRCLRKHAMTGTSSVIPFIGDQTRQVLEKLILTVNSTLCGPSTSARAFLLCSFCMRQVSESGQVEQKCSSYGNLTGRTEVFELRGRGPNTSVRAILLLFIFFRHTARHCIRTVRTGVFELQEFDRSNRSVRTPTGGWYRRY